jgi:hypothetical protein
LSPPAERNIAQILDFEKKLQESFAEVGEF